MGWGLGHGFESFFGLGCGVLNAHGTACSIFGGPIKSTGSSGVCC